MANGAPPPRSPQPVQVQRTRTTIQHVFALELQQLPDGGRQLDVIFPSGEVLSLPLDAEMARQLGGRLIAPSVEVPSNGSAAMN